MTESEQNSSMPRDDSLSNRAYRQLEELIVRLELAPGLALSENALREELGIGRTPIREALHRLAREGLVLISPRRGIFVVDIRLDAQLRLLEVRRGLERLIASRAARLATSADRAEFAKLAAAMKQSAEQGDHLAFLRLDREFNQRVAQASANEFAAAAISLSAGLSRRFWFRYHTLVDFPLSARLHADVATAISNGEIAAAAEASDCLLDYIEAFTRSVIDNT